MKKRLPLGTWFFIILILVAACSVFYQWYMRGEKEADSTADLSPSWNSSSGAVSEASAVNQPETPAVKPETLIIYPPYPEQILRSEDYTVRVGQGGYDEEIEVYDRSTCVETWWGRSEQPDRCRRFCEFAFTGEPVEVQIQVNFPIQSYRVLSASDGLESSYEGQVITILLEKPETFLLELNGEYNTLLTVIAEEPETDIPDSADSKTLVIEGYYEPPGGYLSIDEPDTCIYLAPGAVLCARLSVNADNVTLRGRGVVLDPWSNLLAYDIAEAPDNKLINIKGDHVTIEGIKLLDARNYNLWADFGVDDLKITGVKVLSTAATTDGLTLLGTVNSVIQDCFIYCGDNALVFEEGLAGTQILDCMIGTPCAAIFPQQDIAGDIILDGLYVFRADEGLVNNRYNNKDWDRTVQSVTIRNLNASDCRNLPWFFHGRFMGVQSKNFVFQNIALPKIKCVMDAKLEMSGSLIRIDNYPQDRQTGGYRMSFTDLYVEGTAVEEPLPLKDERELNNVYTVRITQPVCPVRPAEQIMVERQDTALNIEPLAERTVRNLLEERSKPHASIWCAGPSYLTNLSISNVDGTSVYRLAVSPSSSENGSIIASLNLTKKELREAVEMTLRFDASAKTGGEVTLRLSTASPEGTVRIERSIRCTSGWSSYQVAWSEQELAELAEVAGDTQSTALLEVIPQGGGYKEISFRSFDMRVN